MAEMVTHWVARGLAGLCVALWIIGSAAQAQAPMETPAPAAQLLVVPYYEVPSRMELCGEPIPLDSADVRERLDREFTIVVYNQAQVYLWLKRSERYFPWIEKQLALQKLPDDLKYLAVAESDLLLGAVSPAGAAGPWQFIASTARNYGLNQSPGLDERYDFERATEGAFSYLKDLRNEFPNWALAMAAYNCGEQRVEAEIRRQKVSNYFQLKLPQETERYIFRILAIKEVLSHAERYGYVLPKNAGYPVVAVDEVSVQLSAALPVQLVAEAAGITYREFKLLNPAFTAESLPQGGFTLRVPQGRGAEFKTRFEALKASYKPTELIHQVGQGETLSGIAAKYDVGVDDLCQWNQIKGETIHPGQRLRVIK